MSNSAFNSYAGNYDQHFTYSSIGQLQRKRVYNFLLKKLRKSDTVLELNCGTGYDAVQVSQHVQSVIATDQSENMIRQAALKTVQKKNITLLQCDMRDIRDKISGEFDLVFSNFGGLNCLAPHEINRLAGDLSSLVKPHGKVILVIMGKNCTWENFYFRLIKHPGKNRRKLTGGAETVINGEKFLTYYYSPAFMRSAFSEDFKQTALLPIGLFIPPSYLDIHLDSKKMILRILNFLESGFANISALSGYSDHYLIEFQKK